tara:strand:- start:149 stop:541 length:393 start_codon:yes stop_codon:yes gene_type:complete
MEDDATAMTSDFYLGHCRPAPIVVGDAASITAKLAEGLFTATVAAAYLRHDIGYAFSTRIKKLFHHNKDLLCFIVFNIFTKRVYTKYESKYLATFAPLSGRAANQRTLLFALMFSPGRTNSSPSTERRIA